MAMDSGLPRHGGSAALAVVAPQAIISASAVWQAASNIQPIRGRSRGRRAVLTLFSASGWAPSSWRFYQAADNFPTVSCLMISARRTTQPSLETIRRAIKMKYRCSSSIRRNWRQYARQKPRARPHLQTGRRYIQRLPRRLLLRFHLRHGRLRRGPFSVDFGLLSGLPHISMTPRRTLKLVKPAQLPRKLKRSP